jgi:hypothetical protein
LKEWEREAFTDIVPNGKEQKPTTVETQLTHCRGFSALPGKQQICLSFTLF